VTVRYIGTREVPIDELVTYPGNPRRGSVPVIAESLGQLGQYRSVIVRQREGKPLMILAGNHTVQAIASNRETVARVEVIECSDDEAKRINVVDNRSAELATWDGAALAAMLTQFNDDYLATGFTAADAQKVMFGGMPEPGDADTGDDGADGWGIVIELDTEEEQAEWLGKLAGEGLRVRALIQ
jgi:hypothetical protein